jgi:hypothetical protein
MWVLHAPHFVAHHVELVGRHGRSVAGTAKEFIGLDGERTPLAFAAFTPISNEASRLLENCGVRLPWRLPGGLLGMSNGLLRRVAAVADIFELIEVDVVRRWRRAF